MLPAKPIWALGLMSGTSLDGVDGAMLLTDGHAIFEFGQSAYREYSKAERQIISAAFGCWPNDAGVDEAAKLIESAHIDLLKTIQGPDLIGFHGQTLAHDPGGRGTHQVGDGQVLADAMGLPVVWDFRSEDVKMGGQGAPLAPFFHFACAKWIKARDPVVFLNLGGVGNLTWVDTSKPSPETDGGLLAFDTGPANAPINDLMLTRLGLDCDRDGKLAKAGQVDMALVQEFLRRDYFQKIPPKSLDRNDFNDILNLVYHHSNADAAATLTAIAAASVAKAMAHCPRPPSQVLVAGGGRKNPTLMAMLNDMLDCPVQPVESVGLDGDMLEAQAFAYLAVRVLRGLPTSAPMTTGASRPVAGGKIIHS